MDLMDLMEIRAIRMSKHKKVLRILWIQIKEVIWLIKQVIRQQKEHLYNLGMKLKKLRKKGKTRLRFSKMHRFQKLKWLKMLRFLQILKKNLYRIILRPWSGMDLKIAMKKFRKWWRLKQIGKKKLVSNFLNVELFNM